MKILLLGKNGQVGWALLVREMITLDRKGYSWLHQRSESLIEKLIKPVKRKICAITS